MRFPHQEAFNKRSGDGDGQGGSDVKKRIHVRSKDPMRIARQMEKKLEGDSKKQRSSKGRPPPPQMKVNTICKVNISYVTQQAMPDYQTPSNQLQVCGKEPYIVERIVAEKSWWCKNCFRCVQCNKLLNLDTYVSHEGVIYCKPHHKELFQPKVVKEDLVDMKKDKGRNKAGGLF